MMAIEVEGCGAQLVDSVAAFVVSHGTNGAADGGSPIESGRAANQRGEPRREQLGRWRSIDDLLGVRSTGKARTGLQDTHRSRGRRPCSHCAAHLSLCGACGVGAGSAGRGRPARSSRVHAGGPRVPLLRADPERLEAYGRRPVAARTWPALSRSPGSIISLRAHTQAQQQADRSDSERGWASRRAARLGTPPPPPPVPRCKILPRKAFAARRVGLRFEKGAVKKEGKRN
ncbi:hypothetical protein PVAP13_6KG314112 [Panicum virgatum]|uniref:Uncharacterized protein n=1 Tax=Panicum virgatum TaxID=38727 RepID=A0A8T0RHU3_PANVG|nr:hypothetical protein PVAP13_6KG314112 [Panicum virgatum]